MTGDFAAEVPLWLPAGLGFVLGAIVGSYLATLLIRWPQGRSALGGRSGCDHCSGVLGAADLIPVVSFLISRGRCRRCGGRIDRRHVAIELAAALVGLVSVLAHPMPLAGATMLLGWMLLILAALDAEHQWLPDALTLPLVPLGLLVAWAGLGPPLLDRAIGAAAGWLVLALLGAGYRSVRGREGLGGGDPKLLAGIGAWVGALQLPFVLLGAGLVGLVAVAAMRLRGAKVGGATRLPLGTLMALAAGPIWLFSEAIRSAHIHTDLL